MSKFNTATVKASNKTITTNLAGGVGYTESEKLELVSIVLTSFVADQFYTSASDGMARVSELTKLDPYFAAKAAIYARNEFGMRSISHVVAAEIGNCAKGQKWTKGFFNKIVHRPDDMTEIVSLILAGKNKLPNAVRKGFSDAFGRFDEYSLAKYRGEGKGVSLVDVVNMIHPKPNEKNATALKSLVDGTLRSVDTWETKISAAGQAEGDTEELKAEAWKELLQERKLGYFALLRNLRNIIEQAPNMVDLALETLVDKNLIHKSLVLPFRFQTAANEIARLSGSDARKTLVALSKAVDISLDNVPKLSGRTLIMIDGSGSMQGRPLEIASLFGAVLYKTQDADCIIYSNDAHFYSPNATDSTLTIAGQITKECPMGGTNLPAAFAEAKGKYDRIIILSDMQSWMSHSRYDNAKVGYHDYVNRVGIAPKLYSWDLAGYGTLQMPEKDVYCLAGFSEKVLNIMGLLEQDKEALIHTIEAVEL